MSLHLSIIFIVIGGYFLYLAYKKDDKKFLYTKNLLFKSLFIVDDFIYKDIYFRSFKKQSENFYFQLKVNKEIPNFLYDNLKIKYSLFLLIFYGNKINLDLIKNKKIIIFIEYNNKKTLQFCFDNNIYLMIKTILENIDKINSKNIKDIKLFPLDEFYFDKKCERCISIDCKKI